MFKIDANTYRWVIAWSERAKGGKLKSSYLQNSLKQLIKRKRDDEAEGYVDVPISYGTEYGETYIDKIAIKYKWWYSRTSKTKAG